MNAAIDFINAVAPNHERTGCREDNPNIEARFAEDDYGGCYRCTILRAVQLAVNVERKSKDAP